MLDLSDLGKTLLQGAALHALMGFLLWALGTGQRSDDSSGMQMTRHVDSDSLDATPVLLGSALQQLAGVGFLQRLVVLTSAVAKQLPAALAKEPPQKKQHQQQPCAASIS